MTIGDKTRDEKLHYDINREAVKISASAYQQISSGKIDKYENLTEDGIFLLNKVE